MDCDALSAPSPSFPQSSKVLVMVKDWCYTITPFFQDGEGRSRLVGPADIEHSLREIVADVEKRCAQGERPLLLLGALSADDRNIWAKVRPCILIPAHLF